MPTRSRRILSERLNAEWGLNPSPSRFAKIAPSAPRSPLCYLCPAQGFRSVLLLVLTTQRHRQFESPCIKRRITAFLRPKVGTMEATAKVYIGRPPSPPTRKWLGGVTVWGAQPVSSGGKRCLRLSGPMAGFNLSHGECRGPQERRCFSCQKGAQGSCQLLFRLGCW